MVVAIIGIAMALVVPAFYSVGRAGDITKATYDVSGVLQGARSFATSNDTYVWVGFYEENVSSPGTAGVGKIVMSTVASKDGTNIFATGTSASLQPYQLNRLVKISNMHLKTAVTNDPVFPAGVVNGTGSTFDTRPAASGTNAQIGDTSPAAIATQYQFQYPVGSSSAQYTFQKVLQFNPRGEVTVNNAPLTPIVEIGLQSTHGTIPDSNSRNVAAVQITGIGGNVTIYRR